MSSARATVFFDDQIFMRQHQGGISRYFAELMHRFDIDRSLGVELERGSMWTLNEHLIDVGIGRRPRPGLGRRGLVMRAANRLRSIGLRAEIVHHTYYDHRYLALSQGRRRVVTVVDMIPELFPELFPAGNPHEDKRSFVGSADLILCISENTKRDLIQAYGRIGAPIEVTYLGVDDRFSPSAARSAALPDRYILYVGGRSGYKDFPVLAEAFAQLQQAGDVWLIAVGGGPLRGSEEQVLSALRIAERTRHLDLADVDLAGAYAHALAFVGPSRYEGFGLPALEAMASGCPVVLADSSSYPEVAGAAAMYFAPGDHAMLARLLDHIVSDEPLRHERRRAGVARATEFTWAKTALATANAYRMIMRDA